MIQRRQMYFVAVLLIACAAARIAFAAKSIPLKATWHAPVTTYGMFGDGVASDGYQHNVVYPPGKQSVRCYFGVNAKNVVLITYNTGRTLRFVPSATDAADFTSAGIVLNSATNDFSAEIDLFAPNGFGQYTAIGLGNTAKVQADLEFHQPGSPLTFELHYASLAAQRISTTEWVITSDPGDTRLLNSIPPSSGVVPTAVADLNVVRRRTQENFGQVTMPISFTVTLLQ